MYARLASVDLKPGEVEKYRKMVSDRIIPTVQGQRGFKGGYWLIDSESGKGYGVALFESKAALEATDEAAERLAAEARKEGLSVPRFSHCEVVGSIGAKEILAA